MDRKAEIYKVTWVGFFVNMVLSIGKLLAGIFGRSGAMIADAVHSISDFATDLVVLVFVKISSKPKDECHDYGHGKYETMATVIIGIALMGVGIGILIESIKVIHRIVNGEVIEPPKAIALIAAGVSIITKEALYWYTVRIGKKINSPVVVANAWHHRSDALSSIGTLVGIGGAFFLGKSWRILDPIAALIVSLLIMKVSFNLIKPSFNELLERSLPKEIEDEILEIIKEDTAVSNPHNLRTRRIGANIALEIHVCVDPQMPVAVSHAITKDMELRLKKRFGEDTLVIIHVEPNTIIH